MTDVKAGGNKMEQQSAETRSRIVRAAYELFCALGFRAATMEAIGAAAGVSVQTVYFQFRTKNQMLRAVHEWTVLGDEGLPPTSQPWYRSATSSSDPRSMLFGIVSGTAELNARIAPTLPIFATLAREPGGQVYRDSRRMRRDGMEHVVDILRERHALQPGLNVRRAADLLDFLMGPESYAQLVLSSGWTTSEWVEWTADTLAEQLLPEPP